MLSPPPRRACLLIFIPTLRYLYALIRSLQSLLFSRLASKQVPLSQHSLIKKELLSLNQFNSRSLVSLKELFCVSLVLGSPALFAILQLHPHQNWIEGKITHLQSADSVLPNTTQNAIGCLDHKGTFLDHS